MQKALFQRKRVSTQEIQNIQEDITRVGAQTQVFLTTIGRKVLCTIRVNYKQKDFFCESVASDRSSATENTIALLRAILEIYQFAFQQHSPHRPLLCTTTYERPWEDVYNSGRFV